MKYLLLAILLYGGQLLAQHQVVDEQEVPIPGAYIKVVPEQGDDFFISTDPDGRFNLDNTIIGKVEISAFGFQRLIRTIPFSGNTIIKLESSPFSLSEAVVTGQHIARSADETLHKIQVIGKEEIERIGANSLRDILRVQSNIQISEDPVLGTGIRVMGSSGNQVQILLNGIPITGRVDGNIDLDQINLAEVERIEVIEGPMAVEYGSESIGGTINIITKSGSGHSKLNLFGQYESINRSILGASGTIIKGNSYFTPSFSRLYFDGIENEGSIRTHSWKPKEQYNAALQIQSKIKSVDFSIRLDAMKEDLFIDGPLEYQTIYQPVNDSLVDIVKVPTAKDQTYSTDRYQMNTDLSWKYDSLNTINSTFAGSYFRRERFTQWFDLSTYDEYQSLAADNFDTSSFYLLMNRSTWVKKLKPNWSLLSGAEFKHEVGEGKRIEDGQQRMTNIALFGSSEIKLNEWSARVGLRWVHNNLFKTPLIPSLHLKKDFGPINFRASYAKGFRVPDLKELFFYFVDSNHNIRGNTDLEAEHSDNFQLSAAYKKTKRNAIIGVGGAMNVNLVNNQIQLIQSNSNTGLFQYANVDRSETRMYSINTEYVYSWLKISTGINFFNTKYTLGSVEDQQSGFLNSSQANLAIIYYMNKWNNSFEVLLNHVGKSEVLSFDENQNISPIEYDNYQLLSLFYNQEIKKSFQVTFGVKNILDVRNNSAQRVNQNSGAHSVVTGQQLISPGISYLIKCSYTIK